MVIASNPPPTGTSRHREDEWSLTTDTRVGGFVGTLLVHYYSAGRATDPADLSWGRGSAMPDRPGSGDGASATILMVEAIGADGTARRVLKVTGFQAKGRS